jgi:hypothetical protein
MGKSDLLVFDDYYSMICHLRPKSIAFLGFECHSVFTNLFTAPIKDFYDLKLGNWNINDAWALPRKYELVISTRCPYFSRTPYDFVERCRANITPNGNIFLDWGLGDHWRFKDFKVGWVRNGEHEFAYQPDNFLYSCLWRDGFAKEPVIKQFWKHVVAGPYGYADDDDISDIVKCEVPQLVDYDFKKIKFKFLWPEAPQLYIMTLL